MTDEKFFEVRSHSTDKESVDFMQRIFDIAKRTDGNTEPVEQIIADNDIVFCVWPEGSIAIKGRMHFRHFRAYFPESTLKVTAIGCVSFEQVRVLMQLAHREERKYIWPSTARDHPSIAKLSGKFQKTGGS